jgi:hypothetical protein
MKNYLPKHATVLEACEWLATETGEPWTLARLLENSLTPWVWLDYEPRFHEIFGGRLEGFSTPMLFHGDVARLAAGGDNALLTWIQAPNGKPPIHLMPGYCTGIDDLRFLRDDITRLAGKHSAPHGTPAAKVEAVRGIDKRDVMAAFNGLKWDFDHWGKNLASPSGKLKACRVGLGSKTASALWNPADIGVYLLDEGIPLKKLDAVFVGLGDWHDEWREKTALERA